MPEGGRPRILVHYDLTCFKHKTPHSPMKHGYTAGAAVFAVLAVSCLRAQDTRHVIEPRIPPACVTLTAQLTAPRGVISDAAERSPDTVRIQNAIDSCENGKAVALR